MKNPKSREYKRIYNVLWAFYIFFIVVITAVVYVSVDEVNKMTTLSDNYRVMNSIYFITQDISDKPSDLDQIISKSEKIDEQLSKLNLLYYEENINLKEKIQYKNNELTSLLQPPYDSLTTSEIQKITESIKWDSRDFIENIYLKGNGTLSQTKKLVVILVVLAMVVLTLVLLIILLPTIKKLDKLAIQLAKSNGIKEKSIQNLAKRNEEIDFRERRFKTIAELSPIGLFLTDTEGSCKFVNERYVDIIGLSEAECLGDGWKDGIYKEDRERIFQTWYESVKNDEPSYLNEYRINKNGEFRDIAVKAKPIKNEKGEIHSFVGMIEDITTAKETTEDLVTTATKFESFIEDLPYGAVLNNEDGLYFNKVVEQIIGYNNEEINTIDDWFRILYKDNSGEIRKIYEENKGKDFEEEVIVDVITKSGEIKKVSFKDKISEIGEIWGLTDKTELVNAEANRQEINEEYKFILDSIKIGVWDWTIEPNKLVWSDLMYELYGYDINIKVNSYDDYKDSLHPEDVERINSEIGHVLNTPGEEFDTTFRVILSNGLIKHIRAVSKTYRDEQNNAIRMVGLNWDVTSEVVLEEERKELAEKYELISNSAEIGVWDWDFRKDKLTWNETMYVLFDVPVDAEDVYKEYEKRLHPDDRELAQSNLNKIMSGELESYESELRIIVADDSIKYIKSITNIEKADDGNITRLYGISLDISEIKQFQLQLIDAKERADMANKAKSTFLANMSHEIRTPMNAILGFSEILNANNKDERNQDYISGIIKSGNSLLSLINDILDFSKIEANKMILNYNLVDVKRIVDDIDKIFEFTASKKGIQYYSNIQEEIPPYLIMDEGKIKQILINLLGNAVKFTEKGEVKLSVNYFFNNNDTSKLSINFTIEDSGIGISKDKQVSIFDPFEQEEDNDSRKYEGTGLGLSIVKSIVDLHSGSIEIESELGIGSKFIVTIPEVSISLMRPDQISKIAIDEFNNIDLSEKTVLFAEDIESNREVVKGFLSTSKLNILFANNGKEALEIASKNKIDLGFIDLHMPIMDGMTMADIWVNDENLKNIPIVALTAEVFNQDKQEKNNYFKGYLTKPVRAEEIYKTILFHTGFVNDIEIDNKIENESTVFSSELLEKIKDKKLDKIATSLTNKLNTRELSKFIERIEFLSEVEDDLTLRNYTKELKLALSTFNVNKIKTLLTQITT